MKPKRSHAAAMCGAVLLFSAAVAPVRQDQGMPASAPQHEQLLKAVGTWDCAMTMWNGPGEPTHSTGVEIVEAVGAFHVVYEFKSELMDMPFLGHGIVSWDPQKQKYISVWIDSLEPTPGITEGTYDAATNKTTYTGETMMMGQFMHVRQVASVTDADHKTFEMFVTPPGGEEMRSMLFEYTRRK